MQEDSYNQERRRFCLEEERYIQMDGRGLTLFNTLILCTDVACQRLINSVRKGEITMKNNENEIINGLKSEIDSLAPDCKEQVLKAASEAAKESKSRGESEVIQVSFKSRVFYRAGAAFMALLVMLTGMTIFAKFAKINVPFFNPLPHTRPETAAVVGDNLEDGTLQRDYTQILKAIKNMNTSQDGWGRLFSGVRQKTAQVDMLEYGYADDVTGAAPGSTAPQYSQESAEGGMGGEADASQTNVQVEGVDEADIIKNDGSYLYIIYQNRLSIVDIRDPKNMKAVSGFEYGDGTNGFFESANELYIDGDKLIVISTGMIDLTAEPKDDPAESSQGSSSEAELSPEEAYKKAISDAYPIGATPVTHVTIFDISDRENPVQARRFSQEGYYTSSRLTGNNIFLITNKIVYHYDKDVNEENCIPHVQDSRTDSAYTLLPANCIALPEEVSAANFAIVSAFDFTDKDSEVTTKAVLGGGENVYANKTHLYVASSIGGYNTARARILPNIAILSSQSGNTELMRFDISAGKVIYKDKSPVQGTILNQYSMDEYEGHFRVATTYVNDKTDETESGVFIFNDQMVLCGKLDGLAPTEQIKSSRFVDTKLHLVTFRQVDPLFIIDLSDPVKPALLGQLKIPGFSSYMHPYSENLMLGFGSDADENGMVKGMKVSLFDSSDPENPQEIATYLVDGLYSSSEIQYNPKALLFSKEKNVIAFPVWIDRSVVNGNAHVSFEGVSALMVLGIENNTFIKRAEITNEKFTNTGMNYSMLRGAYVGDTIFSVSEYSVKACNMADGFKEVGQVTLP